MKLKLFFLSTPFLLLFIFLLSTSKTEAFSAGIAGYTGASATCGSCHHSGVDPTITISGTNKAIYEF